MRQDELRGFVSYDKCSTRPRDYPGKMMNRRYLCAAGQRLFLPVCCALPLLAQSARVLELQQTRYEVKMGEAVPLAAPSETLSFLSAATTRSIEINGSKAAGFVIAPDRTGRMVLAASPRVKAGEYNVTVSAISATGEARQTTMAVAVDSLTTVPSGSTRNPVVLLNGWEAGYNLNTCPISTSSADTFGNLAQYLVSDGVPVVYLFDNCLIDPNQSIETLGNDLANFLNSIQYDDGTQVPQIDLVGFSLGGLIARSYLAGLQPDESLTPPANTLVGKLVLLATPNFGSFVAGNYATLLAAGTQSAELVPGSSFLWNLANWNQRTDDLRGVSAIAVIGNAGAYVGSLTSTTQANNASDGIVSLTSASAGFVSEQASITRIVPYCQVDPSAFTDTNFGTYACDAPGIANITSASHPTSEIIRSFLAGTSDWQSIGTTPATDPYLSQNGGTFFGLVTASDGYAADLSQVSWGTVQMATGGDISTIFYDDFVTGTGVFEASSASLGNIDCGSYAVTFGYFSAVRCKIDSTIFSVGPLLTTSPRVVSGGGTITISGNDFGSQCNGCKVTALQAGSTTAQTLQISSWKGSAIAAVLPATLTGLVTISVYTTTGADSIAIVAALANPSTIAAAPTGLQFAYTIGGAVPSAQSIQITNSGSGTLSWTAAASTSSGSGSWLSVSPTSGTATSTISISVSPAGLSAGSYNGSVQITASGASNTPLAVPVTLTVTQTPPSLAVAPQALTFNYSVGGSPPAAQSVSITNTGAGTLSWTASSVDYWLAVAPASGSGAATLSVSIDPANLAAGTYTTTLQIAAAGARGSPASIAITLVVQGTQPAPTITAVTNAESYVPGVASATWVSIFGSNLSTSTYVWQASDIVNGALPTSLQGVSVTIDGVPAFIEYISPTQIDLLAPDDATTGPVQVTVTTAQQASNSLTVQKAQFSPAFFSFDNGKYVDALHADYSLVASAGLLPGVTTRPAQPGETILLYGTGFGPTNPPTSTAQAVAAAAVLANSVQMTIGGVNAPVAFAGLVGSGTYQFNVTVPNLPNGDAAVVATIGGVSTQTGVSVTVQQ